MKLTDTAINYRTSVMVLTVILVLGGLYSYVSIPKEATPSIEVPNIVVTTIYPGASPDDIESLITQHVEREIQGVNGIKEIRSTSTEGVSTIIVEFDPDVSIDEAFQKVRDKVDIAKAKLPDDVEEPLVNEIDFSEFPIMTINLAAEYPLVRLKEVAEEIQDELEAIPSVLEVDLIGALEREVQVNVDLNALQGYNLKFDDLIKTIRNENTNLPGGSIDVDRLNYLVRVDGEFRDPAEIENLVIKAPGGVPIYVRDVATVDFGFKDRTSFSRLQVLKKEDQDGHLYALPDEATHPLQVISLNVKKRSGDNILKTVEEVQQVLDRFPYPGGTQVEITGDQSVFVKDLITDLENNIISGLIFVIAVLLFFLGVRTATLVGVAIPLSMFISFIVLQAMGYTLNFIILFSLIIALGMLVDNAIVIVENIYRFREQGHGRFEAAKKGTAEVAGAVIASTATTVAVFAPMLFWPGIIGEFMSYMPLTLIVTLTCSLFVALIINPVITAIFVRLDDEKRVPLKRSARLIVALVIVFLAMILGFTNWRTLLVLSLAVPTLYLLHTRAFKPIGDRFVKTGLPALVDNYRQFLNWMLHRDYSVRRAMLRNTFTLVSFTTGLILTMAGLFLAGAGTPVTSIPMGGGIALSFGVPGLLLFGPGSLLLYAGIAGIVIHTLESVYLGGKASVKVGIGFGLLSLTLLGLMHFLARDLAFTTVANLMLLPLIIIGVGLAGAFFNRRQTLILTDNRARLLNVSLGAFLAIILMFNLAPTGVEFFPDTDPRQIRITAEGPLGMNIEASNEIARTMQERINALLNDNPEAKANIQNILINVGVGGDADFGGSAASPERSRITMNVVDYADRPETSMQTLARLREQLKGIPGAEIEFTKDNAGPPTGAPVNIEISGDDFDQIIHITRDVKQMLDEAAETGRIPGLVDVRDNLNTGRPELKVHIDRERAARFGLNTAMIATTVRAAINGIEAGKYRTGKDEYDITVRLRKGDRASLESLKNLTILDEGVQVPLVAVADLEVSGGLGSITRLDLSRVATVSADAAPGFNGQAILGQVQGYLAAYEQNLPPGYSLSYTGENEEQQESFSFLTVVLLIGVALIFMIMVAQFNHVSSPFIIMVAVGFSLIGVLLGLILTRTPFGLMTFIGVISLAGIVVNNNIVLIDYAMQLRARGMNKHDAIIEAGATRLRPVLLTALTTVIGLIPLTFGINVDFVGLLTRLEPNFQFGSENTQFWGPMGTAIISGLTFATFLTLVIVPVMYSAFDSCANHLRLVFGRTPDTTVPGDGYGPAPVKPLPAETGNGALPHITEPTPNA